MKSNLIQPSNECWDRLLRIMELTGHKTTSLARHIGLPSGSSLNRIKNGKCEISIPLARSIHEHFPQFSMGWILCGEQVAPATPEQMGLVRIPVYFSMTSALAPCGNPVDSLTITASRACGAEFAVSYSQSLTNPFLMDCLLLVRRHKGPIIYNRMYCVEFAGFRIFRMLKRVDHDPSLVGLAKPEPVVHSQMLYPANQITSLWLVVGAVCCV